MIKICHLTSVHRRFDTRIFQKECQSLSQAGYDVSLIVADSKGDANVDNINIYDVGMEAGRLRRFINTTKKIQQKALELNCEIYHFHDPELIFVGLFLKKRGKKVIFDMHEDIPADISEKEYIPSVFRKFLSFLYNRLEIYAVKRFDAIVSTRQTINNRLEKYNANIKIITNFPHIESIEGRSPEKGIVCFAGAIMPNWRHKEIINAIDRIDGVKYVLAGPAEKDYLEELKMLKGWNKVEYLGVISFEEVKEIYKKASIGVAVYVYCKNMDDTLGNLANTKTFEFMNWEIPLVCTDYTLWKEIMEKEENCGLCVNPYDEDAIFSAIKYLVDNNEVAIEMGKNGRKAIENKYNWKTQEKILLSIYEKVIHP